MTSPLALLLPFALNPHFMGNEAARSDQPEFNRPEQSTFLQDWLQTAPKSSPFQDQVSGDEPWVSFSDSFRPDRQFQVRINRRVIIRVSPRRPARASLLAETQTTTPRVTYDERKLGKCVTASGIAGMQPNGDRLILFMRNRSLVSARLNKKCRAKDFYSGFYVERAKDGKLCIKRDELQSRAGSKCKLRSFHRLVPKDS